MRKEIVGYWAMQIVSGLPDGDGQTVKALSRYRKAQHVDVARTEHVHSAPRALLVTAECCEQGQSFHIRKRTITYVVTEGL